MELSNLSLEELVELRNTVNGMIHSYKDGFLYICKVRSYGSMWSEYPNNVVDLEELCMRYDGQDGIVDVYTNNPDLHIENYGDVKFVPTKEDLEKWKNYKFLENQKTLDKLEELYLSFSFNYPLDNLPINLRKLKIGSEYEGSLNNLPDSIVELEFGEYFNQPVEKLPKNLITLKFGKRFNKPIDSLPKSLENIYF